MNPLSSLGIGSNVLNYDVIDKLKKADENAQIAPIDRKLQANIEKQTELVGLKTMLSGLNQSAKKISDYSSYLARNVSVSDESKLKVSANAGVPIQDINIKINELAKNSVNEINKKFSSRDDTFSKFNTNLKFKVGQKEFNIAISNTDTLGDVAQKIIDQTDGLINASIMKTGNGASAYSLMINSKDTGAQNQIYFGNTLESLEIPSGVNLAQDDFNITLIDANGAVKTINILSENSSPNLIKDAIIAELNKDKDLANLIQNGIINVEISGDGKKITINDIRGFELKVGGNRANELFSQQVNGEEDTLVGESSISGGAMSGILSINNKDIDLSKITSISASSSANQRAIVDAINALDGLQAKLNDNGALIINSTTGSVKIGINKGNEDSLNKIGIRAGEYKDWSILGDELGIKSIQKASDANFDYNGVNITRPSNAIDDVVSGVTMELLGVSENPVNVNIGRDSGSIIDEVKAFVEAYNTLIPKLDELTRYDEDTKIAGIFNGVSDIRGIKGGINRALNFSRFVDGKHESIFNYGLSFNEAGVLILDESKLRSEIAGNADKVMEFFRGKTTTQNGKETQSDGAFSLVTKELDVLVGGENAKLKMFEESITNDDKRLKEDRKRSLDLLNSRYEIMANRFAAYDSQIAKVNNSFNHLNMMIEQSIAEKKK